MDHYKNRNPYISVLVGVKIRKKIVPKGGGWGNASTGSP